MRNNSNLSKSTLSRATGVLSTLALAVTTAFQPVGIASVAAQAVSDNYVRITSENASSPRLIRLGLNKSMVVDLPSIANDVLVANPKVADAVMRTSRRIYLFGKQIGQTNVFIFDGTGKQIAALEIVIERDIAGLESSLNRLIKNSDVKAEMINDNMVLTGSVQTPTDAARAVELATAFVEGGEATDNGDSLFESLFGGGGKSKIINLIKIEGEDQVMLKVVIAEIQRNVTKQLGISSTLDASSSSGFSFSSFASGVAQQTISNGSFANIGLNALQSRLHAMEIAGVIRTLAEPTLTAISGEQAEFKVGGTWQIPTNASQTVAEGLQVTYTAEPYGIYLSFVPTVLTEGRISLKLKTEVKEPSSTGASTLTTRANLFATRSRMASTTVELPSGGSMAIAGLVQDDIRQVVSGMPGLSRIPVLGSLFRSKEYIRNETELVIIVTPYLVRPVARKNLAQPDENFQPATNSSGLFMGRVNRVYGTKQGNLPKGRYTGSVGFIIK
ncbi:MAG: type II and III secretion system protein family protein [Rhizobiaceae bacterium]